MILYQRHHDRNNFNFIESDLFLWTLFFTFTLLSGAAVQWVVLPLFLPQWHGGEGLLLGTDSITYHQIAKEQAVRILESGWHNWVLNPGGQVPAGITSFFYALFGPKPSVMLPLYAALHAGSAYLLFKILAFFNGKENHWIRAAAVVPFLAFPSAAIYYTQLLKDAYFIFGNLLFIYAWLSWFQKREPAATGLHKKYISCLVLWGVSYFTVWIVRAYWGPLLFLWSLMFFTLITADQLSCIWTASRGRRRGTYWILTLLVIVGFWGAVQQKNLPGARSFDVGHKPERIELPWKASNWLPGFLDSRLQSLAYSRKVFVVKYWSAGTNIDTQIMFHQAGDLMAYLPRALVVGLFMPTLSLTAGTGHNPGGTLMRRVTGIEMMFLYLSYPFLILAGWSWRKKFEFWISIIWALGGILVFTLVSPNVGALYRFRYGFIMSLMALGILKAALLFQGAKRVSR